jgi:hydrophobic/amphiphilic exporter-1 (mainly G- bacteria), HAE1 family
MARRKREEKLNGVAVSDVAIKQPVFITMMMLLLITFGLLSFRTIPVNLLPDFEVPVIAISVSYPGAGPESVAEQVAQPIEDAVNTVSGLQDITSNSNEGLAVLILEFSTSVNIDDADRDVREKVDQILPQLPQDIRDPVYQKFDPNAAPIMSIAVGAEAGQSSLELRKIIEEEIVPLLQRAEGVGSIDVSGGDVRQINVLMDLEKIQAYQILPAQISRALQTANTEVGMGSITAGTTDVSLRTPSLLNAPNDILDVRITGTPYRVSDVAIVEDGVAEAERYTRLKGAGSATSSEAIILDVLKQSGTNTVQVADNTSAALAEVFADRPDLSYEIVRDDSEAVRSSTLSSLEELVFASIAAFLVVLLFFRNLRSTIITMSGLPVIIIGTFAIMPLFGLTINLITLLALSLCVGLVIDDAIVVRENIFRHTERGEPARLAASRGTAEVALSVVAMTLTVVAVFVPVTFAEGTAGIIFKSFGITVAIAIMLSLVEAFSIAPMLSANVFANNKKPAQKKNGHSPARENDATLNRLTDDMDADDRDASLIQEAQEDPGWLGRVYGRLLGLSLRNIWTRLAVVGIAVAVLFGSLVVASGLQFSFFPEQDPHEFIMGFEMVPGTTLAETDRFARQAEEVLAADPAVESFITQVGFPGNAERAEFFVQLVGRSPTLAAQERLRPQLEFLPDLAFSAPSFEGSSTGVTGRQIQVSLQSTDSVQDIAPFAAQVEAAMNQVPGMVDIASNYRPGKPELQFIANPGRIGDVGITNDDIATSVRALVNGDRATVLRESGEDTDIVVRLNEGDRTSPEALRNIIIPTQSGPVPLSALGTVQVSDSPTTIRRFNKLNQILVGANVEERNVNETQQELAARIDALNLPPNIVVDYVGVVQQQTEGFDSLLLAMALSVLFVYMVLASQFGSFTQPLVIMMAMPFSFIGAFLGLRFAGVDLDITGMIGLIMLLGLVVKNSILLVDFTNRLRQAGMDKHTALKLAGEIRLRPILMTALSLIAGALPIAVGFHLLSTGEGGEFRRGLAVVLIGGMITSTLLTLLVVPTVYSLMESFTDRLGRLFGQRDDDDDDREPRPAGRPAPAPTLTPATAGAGAGSNVSQVVTRSEADGETSRRSNPPAGPASSGSASFGNGGGEHNDQPGQPPAAPESPEGG